MKSITFLLARLLTAFALATQNTLRDIDLTLSSKGAALERTLENEDQKNKRKRKRRPYRRGKRKKRPSFRQKHLALKGTHAKDARYSNQRKLRRMYRNC